MRRSGGGDERIHYRQLLARLLRLSLEPSPTERRIQIYFKNPAGEPLNQIERNPRLGLREGTPRGTLLVIFLLYP
jgi:hypothetical protein